MTSSTYTPREGSVAFRVLEFLCANRDESLSAADVAVKFDCARNNVHTLLAPAVSAGSLIRREDPEDGELVYRVGSGAPAVSVKPAAAPGSASNPFGAARGAARTPFWVDAGQLAIDSDVPLPPPTRRRIDWPSVFVRMAPGDSFALPARAKSSIAKAITDDKKATGREFATRLVDGGIRVWRVS